MKKILFFLLISIKAFSQGSVKISDMPAATSLTGTEIVPIVQGGINKKATVSTWPNNTIVVSSNTTAVNDAVYTVVASATFTDPTPVEGKGFTVFIRNGTGTVGGTGYSVAGTQIRRIFHSGSWANYVGGGDMVLASTQTNTGLKTFLDGTLGMRNVANTFTSQFTNTNSTARTYALPDFSGSVIASGGGVNTFSGFNMISVPDDASSFQLDISNTAGDYATIVMGGSTIVNPANAGALEIVSVGSSGSYDYFPAITFSGASNRFGAATNTNTNTWEAYIETFTQPFPLESIIRFTDNRSTKRGLEYTTSYSAGILANDRSIPDIGTIKSGAFTSTGKKTFSVTGGIAGINVGANATDPTTTLAAGDLYYQTGVGLRVYSGSAWSTLGGGGITNTAANNELMMSNGTNAVPSGIFSTTSGTITTGIWNGTPITPLYGGTGLTGLGLPLQQIRINGAGTAYEYFTPVAGTSLSALTSGTSNNSFDNGGATHTWSWNSLTNEKGFLISSNSPNANVNAQRLFNVELSGANFNSSEITYAASVSNTHTGTSSTNIALNLSASGGTINRALNIAAGEIALNESAGTSGQVLTSQGANATPIWSTVSGGGGGGLTYAQTKAIAMKIR
jgi:hypothetical protein